MENRVGNTSVETLELPSLRNPSTASWQMVRKPSSCKYIPARTHTHTSLHVLHRGVDRYLRRDLPHRASKRITNTMKCSVCNLLTRCSLLTRDRRGIWKNTGGKTRDEEQRIYDSGNHRGQQRRSKVFAKVFIVRVSVVGILFNDRGER